jgi:hypothetical protein
MVGREARAKIVPLRARRRERAQAQQDVDRGRFSARSIDRDSFFVRQDRMLDPLLAWGVGNIIGGGGLAAARGGATRSIGLQAMLWGSIDTTFAVRWQLAARRNALAARSGEMSADAIHDEALWFERVQALNTGLGALYIAAGAVQNTPYMGTLFGIPVVISQHCQAIGTAGDIFLFDLSKYITLTKGDGIQSAMSIHLFFDYNVSTFRFNFRVAGQPWLSAPITSANGSYSMSPFINLAAR